MKKHLWLTLAAAASLTLASCSNSENNDEKESGPVIETLTVPESVNVPGTVSFQADVADNGTDLSTLEVSVALEDGTAIDHISVRTRGRAASVSESLTIPFAANMADGSNLVLNFELVNIKGTSVKQVKNVKIVRPSLPETLYIKIGDNTYPMTQSDGNSNIYETAEGSFENVVTASVSTSEDFATADIIWGKSSETNKAEVCDFSSASGVSVSYPSLMVKKFTFNTLTFVIGAEGDEFNISIAGTALTPKNSLLYAGITFTQGQNVTISGIENISEAYNRDFLSPADGGGYTFLCESGTYDVYYSPKYNYIWIAKMDAVAPECLWIIGHGFTCAPVWNTDYATGGWENDDITRMGYAPKIADGKYQCSMYLSDQHEWSSFEFEVYSDRQNGKANGFGGKSLSGFTNGVALSNARDGMPGLTSSTGFQPGYYVITFDNNSGDINLNRLSEWKESGGSGIFIGGKELIAGEEYDYAEVVFVKGASVSFSGIDVSELNRDFFTITDGTAIFAGVSGTYQVRYFPKYKYVWIYNESQAYPDCIYLLGSGKWSAPTYPDGDDSILWQDVAYNRIAPYFTVAPKIADNTYKATMSMSTSNHDWRVLVEFYSDLNWGQNGVKPIAVTGSAASRFILDGTYLRGVDEKEDPFVPGNYQFIITSTADGLSIDITKVD